MLQFFSKLCDESRISPVICLPGFRPLSLTAHGHLHWRGSFLFSPSVMSDPFHKLYKIACLPISIVSPPRPSLVLITSEYVFYLFVSATCLSTNM